MTYTVEQVSEATQEEMVQFLLRHEDFALFLLGNYEAYGIRQTDAPNSGNFMIIRDSKNITCVICHCKRGSLLIAADVVNHSLFEEIIAHCPSFNGLLGEWNICAKFWDYLKKKGFIKKETFTSKEILYSADLTEMKGEPERKVRLLKLDDYAEWIPLRKAYLDELKLPQDLSEEQIWEQYRWRTEKQYAWGLFSEGKLVSMAELNAKAFDLGQLGGVYTPPPYRRRGFSRTLVRQMMHECRKIHGMRKMVIFTDEENTSARRVYESLNVKPMGYFALFFGTLSESRF